MSRDVTIAPVRIQLSSPGNTQTMFQDLSGLIPCVGALSITGRVVIVDLEGTFTAGVGIQSFASDVEVGNLPVLPSVNATGTTGLGLKSTQSKNFFSFDPTNTSNGDISAKFRFRLGVLYKSSGAAASRGDVLFEGRCVTHSRRGRGPPGRAVWSTLRSGSCRVTLS